MGNIIMLFFSDRKKGFTLIEILVVIAIIGIVATVTMVAISQSFKDRAKEAKSLQYADSVRAQLSTYELAWWKFEEPAGATGIGSIKDVWDGGYHGTPSGGVTMGETGVGGGRAFKFNGSSGQIYGMFSGNSLKINNNTIEAWINVHGFPPGGAGIQSNIIGAYSYSWHISVDKSSQKVTFRRWGPWQSLTSSESIELDKWYHIAVVISNDGSNVAIYINGKYNGSRSITSVKNIISGYSNIRIAFRQQDDINWFNGWIDEVRIHSNALTAEHIKKIYVESAPRYGIALK